MDIAVNEHRPPPLLRAATVIYACPVYNYARGAANRGTVAGCVSDMFMRGGMARKDHGRDTALKGQPWTIHGLAPAMGLQPKGGPHLREGMGWAQRGDLHADWDAATGGGGLNGRVDHGQALDVVVTLAGRRVAGLQRVQEGAQRAGDPRLHLPVHGGDDAVEARDRHGGRGDHLGHGRVLAVPDGRTARADGSPCGVPGGMASFTAAAAAVGEPEAAGHFEDRGGAGVAVIPAPGRIELVAVDRDRLSARSAERR